MTSPTLRPRDDVVHRQMLRQEMRPTPIAVPALSAVKHNLRLAQRRRRLTIRPHRNIRPSDSLNTTHQTKLIPSPLLHQLHRRAPDKMATPRPSPNNQHQIPIIPHKIPPIPIQTTTPITATPPPTTTVPSPASHLPPPPRGRLRGGPRVRATGRPRGGHHPNKRTPPSPQYPHLKQPILSIISNLSHPSSNNAPQPNSRTPVSQKIP